MVIPEGYKKTEIGVIPEDWECVHLLSKCVLLNGLTYAPSNIVNNGLLVLRSSNIQNNQLSFMDNVYVNLKVDDEKLIQKDDIIICVRNGSSALIGKCAQASRDYPVTFGAFMAVLRGKSNNYIFQLLQQGTIQRHISKNSGATINQITNGDFKEIFVPFPLQREEQQRIAETLSDVDSMITSLEKLIEKKKAIKQGAMQELLTGKKRLPGFSGEISYKSLKSLCDVFSDGDWIESKDQSKDGIRLIQTGNVGVGRYLDKTDKQRFISEDTFQRLNCFEIFENDVLVSRLPDPAGRACIIPVSSKRRITSVDCTVVRFFDYNPVLFVAYTQTKEYQDKIDMSMAGSTRQRISRKELGEIEIPVFPTSEEQTVIASILSDMDNEIEALEQKLAKTRQLKQGMMQQLLTGKIRLV